MIFKRFYSDSIAQASFLIGCGGTGEAVVVDPTRDVDVYLEEAAKEGLKIVAVTETHIHADYVSGSRELAGLTGATLYLSSEGGPDWQYEFADEPNVELIGDGAEIVLGNVRVRAVHTPGHTPEHLTFLVYDVAASDQPFGALTGDFIFAGDVGRPDLLEVAAGFKDTMRAGADNLFDSIEKFKSMPDWLTIWPGHGSGSACGKHLGGVPATALGYEKRINPSLGFSSKSEFVEDILTGQPEPPKYFARMKRINKIGPNPTQGRWNVSQIPLNPNAQLVDVRPTEEFMAGSVSNAISIPLNGSFSKWAGSLLDVDRSIVILASSELQAREAAKAMILIGIEDIAGWMPAAGHVRLPALDAIQASNTEGTILDVRSSVERTEGEIPGSIHRPLVYLADPIDLPEGKVLVHCESGGRATIGASFLRSKGIDAIVVQASFKDFQQEIERIRSVTASLFPV